MTGGERLQQIRKRLGLSLRDVESASNIIAERHSNREFAMNLSRLSDIESKGVLPSIFRLHTLAAIYRMSIREVLALYDIAPEWLEQDRHGQVFPASHPVNDQLEGNAEIPLRLDPGFDPRQTTDIKRMVQMWGAVPVARLQQFQNSPYAYGYIGSEDYTMYPLLMPGTFLQIDTSVTAVVSGPWRSEYERPIYFVEMHDAYACCWCEMDGRNLLLVPHSLSQARVRVMPFPQEAEIMGQVVGIAMRLESFRAHAAKPSPSKERT